MTLPVGPPETVNQPKTVVSSTLLSSEHAKEGEEDNRWLLNQIAGLEADALFQEASITQRLFSHNAEMPLRSGNSNLRAVPSTEHHRKRRMVEAFEQDEISGEETGNAMALYRSTSEGTLQSELFSMPSSLRKCKSEPTNGKQATCNKSAATDILKVWLFEHIEYPYPTPEEKQQLCEKTNMSPTQIRNWFTNFRKRHWNPVRNGREPRSYVDFVLFKRLSELGKKGLHSSEFLN